MIKEKMNKSGWYITRHGIVRKGITENSKGIVTIQWSLLDKSKTKVIGINHLVSTYYNVDVFMLKSIDGVRLEGLFDSEVDALRYLDKSLINRGKQPKYIFKKK